MAATTTEGTGYGSVDKVYSKIVNSVVKTENVQDGTLSTADLRDSAVSTSKIAANAVTVAKMNVFKSAEQTGTGSSQNVAHGLGVVPGLVMIMPTDLTPATAGSYAVTEGTHTTTNVVVTVTTGKKFKVIAFV